MKSTEQSVREDLAALYRLMHHMGLSHRIYNHHSARVPDDPDVILINSFGLSQDEVCASNLIKVGHDDNDSNQAASVIHWGIYDARDDVNCIVHHHSAATVAMSALDCGLLPMSQGAMQFFNRIGYHTYEGMTFNLDECPRLAASLGPHRAMLLKNHGALICARSVAEAYVLTDDLEKACKSQLLAMSSGANIVLPDDEICERTARQFEGMPQPRGESRDWPAALRTLERLNVDYRD
jgi:ribulose-5-phosphate 4-epimerase/fuculose-1-phosphate aldolase